MIQACIWGVMKKRKVYVGLDWYQVGDFEEDKFYGLKLSEAVQEEDRKPGRAGDVLLPTHAPHTRFQFAKIKAQEILTELSRRVLLGNYFAHGGYATEAIEKINQCNRIMNYYCKV